MIISRTNSFKKDYKKLTPELRKAFVKQLTLFSNSVKHPSLGIKKIKGVKNIFEARVTKSCRFTFSVLPDKILLRRIGDHDKTLNHP